MTYPSYPYPPYPSYPSVPTQQNPDAALWALVDVLNRLTALLEKMGNPLLPAPQETEP